MSPKISLIACVRNDLCMSQESDLLLNFAKTTTIPNNVVVTDNETYKLMYHPTPIKDTNFSDIYYRLKKLECSRRINPCVLCSCVSVVLTNNKDLLCKSSKQPLFMTFQEFVRQFLKKQTHDIFVIGKGTVFLEHPLYFPTKVYLNVITPKVKQPKVQGQVFKPLDLNYKLIGYTEKTETTDASYRTLFYNRTKERHQEQNYLDLMKNILDNGNIRDDRTGTGTISLFGTQMRFDISESIPLMTTKRVPFRIIVEELLWFCRGDTDAKILERKNINIWKGNTSREFLDSRGLNHYPEGIIGPQYGFLWRHFGAKYSPDFADTSKIDPNTIGGFDQLKYVEDLLENDPFSRRIMISAWNPAQLSEQVLPSCHHNIQFYVTESNGQKYLSCMFTMRSSDQIAHVWNCTGYSLLTYILAARHNMKPKELIYVAGDTHIYSNNIEAVKEQLTRTPRPFPRVKVSESVKTKDWKDMSIEDFDLIGYFPHPTIKIQMAI